MVCVWKKSGLVFQCPRNRHWARTHAQLPTVDVINEDRIRVYYSTRDGDGRSHISFFDVAAENPANVIASNTELVLGPGEPGAFDDAGVMPSCVVATGSKKYLYYTGWSLRRSVPYQTEIGLAVSEDGGEHFERFGSGPIMGRTADEPFVNGSPFVMRDGEQWRCWYHSGTEWREIGGHWEANYRIVYADSIDGINWSRANHVAIDFASADEGGIGRGTVVAVNGGYGMWFSYRSAGGFRGRESGSYRIGYAHSPDGIQWQRSDDLAGIDVGADEAWDSEMIAYPCVFSLGGQLHMFYNGNGFGQSGIGHAILAER